MTDQKKLFLFESEEELKRLHEEAEAAKKRYCKYHPWAQREAFVDLNTDKNGIPMWRCIHCEQVKLRNKKERQSFWLREKEEISDKYVETTLRSGRNAIKTEIPRELIEAKRAVIQVKRLVKKMEEPILKCAKHGNCFKDDVIKSGKSQWTGEQKYKCRKCMKDLHKAHYELHKTEVLLKNRKRKQENPEKVRLQKLNSRLKKQLIESKKTRERFDRWEKRNPQHAAERNRKFKIQSVNELNDSYVRQSLVKRTGLKCADIPQELIEEKRAILTLKRRVKKDIDQDKILKQLEANNEQKQNKLDRSIKRSRTGDT
jgi:hypothetical protein